MKLTKKRRLEIAREVIDRNVLGRAFSPEDTAEMNYALGTNYQGFERRHNPRHPTDPRHLYRQDMFGWESLSWNKCINPISDTAQIKAVLRESIAPCIAEAKVALSATCEHCGSASNTTVDHTDPPFDDIANDYLKGVSPEIQPHPSGSGWMFKVESVEAHWITFHAARATYQTLCRSCNASKGKRGMSFLQSKSQDLFA